MADNPCSFLLAAWVYLTVARCVCAAFAAEVGSTSPFAGFEGYHCGWGPPALVPTPRSNDTWGMGWQNLYELEVAEMNAADLTQAWPPTQYHHSAALHSVLSCSHPFTHALRRGTLLARQKASYCYRNLPVSLYMAPRRGVTMIRADSTRCMLAGHQRAHGAGMLQESTSRGQHSLA